MKSMQRIRCLRDQLPSMRLGYRTSCMPDVHKGCRRSSASQGVPFVSSKFQQTYSFHSQSRLFSSASSSDTSKKARSAIKNSYLKVDFEKPALSNIFEALMHVKQSFDRSVDRPRDVVASRGHIDAENQPLQIRPRLFKSLELVLFSAGENFGSLPPEVIMAFHEKVVQRLDDSGYALEGNLLKENNIAHPDDYWFRASEMKLFPPESKNLIILTFHTSVSWLCIYEDIQAIANKFPELPHRITEKDKILRWSPLMVLAEVSGGTGRYAKERGILSTVMAGWPLDIDSRKQTISMGGRYPEQIQLAWDFCDLRKRPANDEFLKQQMKDDIWKDIASMGGQKV